MSTPAEFYASIRNELAAIEQAGLFKRERIITSPQGGMIDTADGRHVINLCANNYLGLSSHPTVIEAAHRILDERGFGLSSVRFICGTQDQHKELERRLSGFVGTEDTILYGSAFDANGGLFETLFGAEDAIISDELNHASIIDGTRLAKAKRFRYKHNDLADLRARLDEADAAGARFKIVFTDGVFSMDGTIARLDEIRAICDEFGALLGVDDSHATGFLGTRGRGTHEYRGVFGKIDIITGTLGKALGGASGGFERLERAVQLVLGMQRADLDPDAGLALGYDRIEETNDIDAALEQLLGELLGLFGVVNHHRNDRVLARLDVEAQGGKAAAEQLGVALQPVAQFRPAFQEVEHRDGGADDGRRDCVGKEVRARALAQQCHDIGTGAGEAAGRPAQRLAQRAGYDIHAAHNMVVLVRATTCFADETNRM